ncbi:hypothetical protein [Streptomyces sp. R08]|uniref:Uncharacterized protein n=1 Tax=Streptomyces sp. R08 TaxID=3238624 RepID=A0AB39MR15_9ACTN
MIGSRGRVDVVLNVYTEDDAYRVRMVGVYQPGQSVPPIPPSAIRNVDRPSST